MKIVWNPNPLLTVVELDDFDKRLLWHKVKIKELEERIISAHVDLADIGKGRSLEESVAQAIRSLDVNRVFDEGKGKNSFNGRVDHLTAEYTKELTLGHIGDCTCVPCSCLKCHAENLLGIDTLAGLGKHEAAKIGGAFAPENKPARTLSEVIAYLADYESQDVPDWGLPHVPRWREEAKRAHEWLVAYQREHFTGP